MANNYQLPDGKSVDLSNYEIVLFMQHGCHFCHHFDPKLRQFAKEIDIMVGVFTLDGEGDDSFPDAKPATQEIVDTLFSNLEIATPTTFLLNRLTNEVELLAQGDVDIEEFKRLLDESLSNMEKRSE